MPWRSVPVTPYLFFFDALVISYTILRIEFQPAQNNGAENVKRFVNVHLHCIVSNLKRIRKISVLLPGNICAHAHDAGTSLLLLNVSQVDRHLKIFNEFYYSSESTLSAETIAFAERFWTAPWDANRDKLLTNKVTSIYKMQKNAPTKR